MEVLFLVLRVDPVAFFPRAAGMRRGSALASTHWQTVAIPTGHSPSKRHVEASPSKATCNKYLLPKLWKITWGGDAAPVLSSSEANYGSRKKRSAIERFRCSRSIGAASVDLRLRILRTDGDFDCVKTCGREVTEAVQDEPYPACVPGPFVGAPYSTLPFFEHYLYTIPTRLQPRARSVDSATNRA